MVCEDIASSLTHSGSLEDVADPVAAVLKDWAGLKEEAEPSQGLSFV